MTQFSTTEKPQNTKVKTNQYEKCFIFIDLTEWWWYIVGENK